MPRASTRLKFLERLHQSAVSVAIHRKEAITAVLDSSSDSEPMDEDDWTDVSSDNLESDSSMVLSPISIDSSVLSVALGASMSTSESDGNMMSMMEEIDVPYRDMLSVIEALEV